MKNLIWTLFVLTLFGSCVTQKKCALKFPQVARYDSIYIQKLDTFKIVLRGDSVKIITKVPCDNFELITENGKLTSALKVVNGILSQRINIKPDTIFRYTTKTETKTQVVKIPEIQYQTKKFIKVLAWIGGGCILAFLILAGLKLKKVFKL